MRFRIFPNTNSIFKHEIWYGFCQLYSDRSYSLENQEYVSPTHGEEDMMIDSFIF